MTGPPLFPDDDGPQILALLAALDADLSAARICTIDGGTPPKARVRLDRKHVRLYQPGEDLRAEKATAARLRELGAPEAGNVAVACVFYRADATHVDSDNLVKHVLDSATGVLWVNDSQVTAQVGVMALDRGRPRTVVGIAPHRCSLRRQANPEMLRAIVVGSDPLRQALAEEAQRG